MPGIDGDVMDAINLAAGPTLPVDPGVTINVFVLDDHDVVVRGLVDLIEAEADMAVVGTATTEREAIGRIAGLEPDVAILDVRLVEGCGLNVCRQLSRRRPSVSSVMLTSIDDRRVVVEASEAGAKALCHKRMRASEIIDTIRAVANGAMLLDENEVARARDALMLEDELALAGLNEQERRIVELIGRGWANRQIGDEMILAEKTVKNYVSRLLGKLGLSRRAEVAALAGRVAERRAEWEALTA